MEEKFVAMLGFLLDCKHPMGFTQQVEILAKLLLSSPISAIFTLFHILMVQLLVLFLITNQLH